MDNTHVLKSDPSQPFSNRVSQTLETFFLFLSWLPYFFYRVMLLQYVKNWKEDLSKALCPMSSNLVDNLLRVHNNAVQFSLTINGKLTLDEITQLFEDNVLAARQENKIRYPELKQYPSKFGGYWFWKQDADYNIKNHIHEWTVNQEMDDLDLKTLGNLHQDILNRAWSAGRSPWELILVKTRMYSYLFLRVHHCMADGKSLIKLLVECLAQKKFKASKPSYQLKSCWKRTLDFLRLPYDYMNMIILSKQISEQTATHPWNVFNAYTPGSSPKTWVAISPKISMSKLKAIAKAHDAFPTSIIMSIISGAVGKQLNADSFSGDPNYLHFSYTVPKPNHPPTLSNHVYIGAIQLPIGKQHSPTSRLRVCNIVNKTMKNSQIPKCFELFLSQLGSWTVDRRRKVVSKPRFSVLITNMAFDNEGVQINGHPISNIVGSLGLHLGTPGVGFMILGYVDDLQISIVANSNVVSEGAAQAISEEVVHQFEELFRETIGIAC